MDLQLAEAVLEFGNDLREAAAVAETWAEERLRGQPVSGLHDQNRPPCTANCIFRSVFLR